MNLGGLLQRIVTGNSTDDPGAIGLLYQWYGGKIYRAAYYVLNDKHLAEDVVQDTFITAMNKLDTLRDPAKAEAWLVRTAINKSHDVLRGKRKATLMQRRSEIAAGDTVLDQLLDAELRREVIAALHELPLTNQEVIYYKFFKPVAQEEWVHRIFTTLEQ